MRNALDGSVANPGGEIKKQPRDLSDPKSTKIVFGSSSEKFALLGGSQLQFWKAGSKVRPLPSTNLKPLQWRMVDRADLSSDLRRLAGPVLGGPEIRVWDLVENKEICMLAGHQSIREIGFSPCDKWIFSSSDIGNKGNCIWDANNGKLLAKLDYPVYLSDFAISPDGTWLASAATLENSHEVVVWELPSGKKLLTLKLAAHPFTVAFSRQGDRLAAATKGACYVWALEKAGKK